MANQKDEFTRKWIIQNAVEEIQNYAKGVLTIRGLHYRLVARGMTNTLRHYKRVVQAMIAARWEGRVDFDTFSDNDRAMIGYTRADTTDVDDAAEAGSRQIELWMTSYWKNRWENQPYYPEVFIEKKALQGVFSEPCKALDVALGACKGYPSLTFLYDTAQRFKEAVSGGKIPIILYFGDYDPSGEDIPRSIEENLRKMGVHDIEVRRISLLEDQVVAWGLPPAPVKIKDSRTASWDGLGQVELDAVEPTKLREMCTEAIESVFDDELYEELKVQQDTERSIYQRRLLGFVKDNFSDEEE